ncbi:DUF3131 domain-containing protein [Photobacterium kasasachensis]|uniref:DUF3131 domain-containing protein n=1 Tax=Photobacterium kasasachensis TaxID=2910240 RepID=UPI003D0FFB84
MRPGQLLLVQTTSALLLLSSLVIAQDNPISDTSNSEPKQPSFYGNRAITQSKAPTAEQKITFQRRAIAPPIVNQEENKKEEKASILATEARTENQKVSDEARLTISIPLTQQERMLANKAHYYIEQNWNPNTGFIDSVQGYHHSTMWDIASSIGAILALEALELLPSDQASSKLEALLSTLGAMPLYNGKLPNREYNTKTGLPSGSLSSTASNGNGWSALDIGRLLIWLEITAKYKPEFINQIVKIKKNWSLADAVNQQNLYGEYRNKQRVQYRQEGRLGYLQYAAQGYSLSGYDVSKAYEKTDTQVVYQGNTELIIDKRNLPYFTPDPYVLNAIELGIHDIWWDQLEALYSIHKNQFNRTDQLWIFAEDAISKAPWFSYNNIYFYGKSWLSTSAGGKPIENPQVFSNKIAFALSVIFNDAFSERLQQQVIKNSRFSKSVPTGVYLNNAPNLAYNINTNSLILVSLWFKHRNKRPILEDAVITDNKVQNTRQKSLITN